MIIRTYNWLVGHGFLGITCLVWLGVAILAAIFTSLGVVVDKSIFVLDVILASGVIAAVIARAVHDREILLKNHRQWFAKYYYNDITPRIIPDGSVLKHPVRLMGPVSLGLFVLALVLAVTLSPWFVLGILPFIVFELWYSWVWYPVGSYSRRDPITGEKQYYHIMHTPCESWPNSWVDIPPRLRLTVIKWFTTLYCLICITVAITIDPWLCLGTIIFPIFIGFTFWLVQHEFHSQDVEYRLKSRDREKAEVNQWHRDSEELRVTKMKFNSFLGICGQHLVALRQMDPEKVTTRNLGDMRVELAHQMLSHMIMAELHTSVADTIDVESRFSAAHRILGYAKQDQYELPDKWQAYLTDFVVEESGRRNLAREQRSDARPN